MQHSDTKQADAGNDAAAPTTQAAHLLGPGIAFLACGVTFLATGLATHLIALWAMAPAFIALGVVFIALERKRQQASRKD
jgi:membrane protein implicated in regulation of membrane protease activity